MGMGKEKDIFDDMSLILLMYNISQNGIKFARSKSKELTIFVIVIICLKFIILKLNCHRRISVIYFVKVKEL